jgi:ABC-type spermidine/putrescine transport system permease subunit II
MLVVASGLLAAQGLGRARLAGRPLSDALVMPMRMGPHLATGLAVATLSAVLRW